MLTVMDALREYPLNQAIQDVEFGRAESEKFFDYICSNGWFFQDSKSPKSAFKAKDICWIYSRVRGKVFFSPSGIKLSDLRFGFVTIEVCGSKGPYWTFTKFELGDDISDEVQFFLNRLKSIIPWAIFGYNDITNDCWILHNEHFRTVVKKRIELIELALRTGKLSIESDGSLKASESFQLPNLHIYQQGKFFLDESSANAEKGGIEQGQKCASCGKKFGLFCKPSVNSEQVFESYPEFKGKTLCKSCANQYKSGINERKRA